MRVVVTGASGFIGSYLVDRLLERGDEVHAWVRAGSPEPAAHKGVVARHEVDLLDPSSVSSALSRSQPAEIHHLAAQSLPTVSWQQPWETFRVNVAGTVNLLEAAKDAAFAGPLVVFGSSSEYAEIASSAQPMSEEHPLGANSPYAASKVAASQIAQLYHRRHRLSTRVVRPFFWIGPRKAGDFCSDVARKVIEIEKGRLGRLGVGNLDVVRDFLDVRDGVEAVLRVARDGKPGQAYNICSGTGTALSEVIETYRRLSPVPVPLWTDPQLVRPIDEPIRVGDPARVVALGWQPMRRLADTLAEIVAYWRALDQQAG
jgi:GDP-4-dehydro-6-deoxy-D-mannose reductase